MADKSISIKRKQAKEYFLKGYSQKEIALKVDVSEVSISKWAKEGKWAAIRAAQHVSRPELITKLLTKINIILDKTADNEEIDADKLVKLAAMIRGLDKQNTIVDVIDVFMNFHDFLQNRAQDKSIDDVELTDEFIKKVNKYQDLYINQKMALK